MSPLINNSVLNIPLRDGSAYDSNIDNADLPLLTAEGSAQVEERASTCSEPMERTEQTAPLSYPSVANKLFKLSAPLSLSKLGMALHGVGNGIVVRSLKHNEMAAVPLAMASISELLTFGQGVLQSTGVFVGELSGAQEYSEIGEVVNQSWWVGLGLSLPAVVLLRNVSSFLNAADLSEEVVHAVQEYCSAFSYGVIPAFLCTSDLLFAQGIKQPKIVVVVDTVNAGVSMLFSYSLALGALGLPRLGIAGLGYGAALSAWSGFIGLRLYYKFSGQHDHFKLFTLSFPKIKDIPKFFKVGLPIGLNNAMAGLNAVILSLLAGKLGKEVSMAQEASSVSVSAFNMMLTGLVLATGIEIANVMGELKAAIDCGSPASIIERLQQNIKRFGHAGIIIGTSITLCVCLLFTVLSKQISEVFIGTSDDVSEETRQLAQTLLKINGVSLFIDTIKNISTSNLQGLQDTLFSSLLNITATFIGLSTGAYMALQANKGSEWLFISQLMGSLIAAVGTAYRWSQKSNFNENQNMILPRLA